MAVRFIDYGLTAMYIRVMYEHGRGHPFVGQLLENRPLGALMVALVAQRLVRLRMSNPEVKARTRLGTFCYLRPFDPG
jgi:hypothetical protein